MVTLLRVPPALHARWPGVQSARWTSERSLPQSLAAFPSILPKWVLIMVALAGTTSLRVLTLLPVPPIHRIPPINYVPLQVRGPRTGMARSRRFVGKTKHPAPSTPSMWNPPVLMSLTLFLVAVTVPQVVRTLGETRRLTTLRQWCSPVGRQLLMSPR